MTGIYWPVPDSYAMVPPSTGMAGSFWENRGDRWHCGVDLYAPHGSDVCAVEDGRVLDTGVMTSPDALPYWNKTYYVLVGHGALVAKYAELHDMCVTAGGRVAGGEVIGHVGTVLNRDAITAGAPAYIRRLADRDKLSMLHFELYRQPPVDSHAYLGGNWFGDRRPTMLVDPTGYLEKAAQGI
ncbi:MAG: M23 family metallopeptidase [Thermoplasmatota archaeon]